MPKVTVVIPTYHHHQYLEQCICSVLLNNEKAKIVLVPVRRDDDTWERILWLLHDHPQLEDMMDVVLSPEANPIYQMQLGLQATRTKYVTFFGSDDFMLPSKLRIQVALAESIIRKNPNIVPIINPNLIMADEDLSFNEIPKTKPFKLRRMMSGCILTEAALTTTEALNSIGGFYDPDGKDWGYLSAYAMWLRLLKHRDCQVEMLTTPQALYRQLPTSRHKARYRSKKDMIAHRKRLLEVSYYYFPMDGD